jgi:hypothetical protein
MEKIQTFQTNSSNFLQETILGQRVMTIIITWNSRSEAWYLSLKDEDTANELDGIKLVPNWLLIRQYHSQLPNFEGDLIIIKTDNDVEERITYNNLGNGWDLFYVTQDEAEQWEDFYGLG